MNLEHISSEALVEDRVRKENAWKVISDFKEFARYSKNIDKIIVSVSDETEQVSEWDVTFDGAPLNWIQKDLLDQKSRSISFHAISGDFDQFKGMLYAKVSPDDAMVIGYSLDYAVGIPIIEELFGPVFREKMQINFDFLVNALAKKIQEHKIIKEERAFRRYKIGVMETMIFNGTGIKAKIENISRQGMLFTCEAEIEKPIDVHFCGLALAPKMLHYEIPEKKYRLVFEEPIDDKRLDDIVRELQGRHITTMGKFFAKEPEPVVYS
jgi:ribosome-associated toxin RatA of RatAB toxin-antitoxin module